MQQPRQIILLGATGSIGRSALEVIRRHPDQLQLVGIAAHREAGGLARIAREFGVRHAVLADDKAYREAREKDLFPATTELRSGADALVDLVSGEFGHCVLVAIVGTAGLRPTLAAIQAGKDIALASKEVLVMAGEFVRRAVDRAKVRLLPVDSEHNALFQCLEGRPTKDLHQVILTASGGAFRDHPLASLAAVTPEEAVTHPNWSMGRKITVDSATMANKGLEVIEAKWLFDLRPEKISVLIHPQSLVHALVEWTDRSVFAQLSRPQMTFAIQHCLLYPERGYAAGPSMDWREAWSLDFRPPDPLRYPALGLAFDALRAGASAPAIFNAANEVAVEAFLDRQISFTRIPEVIARTLAEYQPGAAADLETLLDHDAEARRIARQQTAASPVSHF